MTDLDHLLADVLREDAAGAPPPHDRTMTVRRIRRRQVRTVVTTIGVVVALIGSALAGASWLLGRTPTQPALGPFVTETEHGVSISYPRGWTLAGTSGLESAFIFADSRYPRAILELSPTGAARSACPTLGTDQVFLAVVRVPLTLNGPGSSPWPVKLEPSEPAAATSLAAPECTDGWRYRTAAWTSGDRSFNAIEAIGPHATARETASIRASFTGLRFEPVDVHRDRIVALLDGTTDGERWWLLALRSGGQPEVFLVGHAGGGSGLGGGAAHGIRAVFDYLGPPGTYDGAYFGFVDTATASLEIRHSTVPGLRPVLLDIPDTIASDRNAFYMPTPRGAIAHLVARDAIGGVVGHWDVGGTYAR